MKRQDPEQQKKSSQKNAPKCVCDGLRHCGKIRKTRLPMPQKLPIPLIFLLLSSQVVSVLLNQLAGRLSVIFQNRPHFGLVSFIGTRLGIPCVIYEKSGCYNYRIIQSDFEHGDRNQNPNPPLFSGLNFGWPYLQEGPSGQKPTR